MAITQHKSKRKITGGLYKVLKGKKLHSLAGLPAHTKIDKRKLIRKRTQGNNLKIALLNEDFVNVFDKKTGKFVKTKILTVVDNPANRNFVRRNIITKGSIIKTEIGNVKITSRPGQHGTINGVLQA